MLRDGEKLRGKLAAGDICLGTWTDSCDPCITELLCGSGFDFLIIDRCSTSSKVARLGS